MAIKLFKVDNFHSGLHKEFFIDGESDLEQIEVEFDCELGDKAYAPNGTIYIRHSDEFDGDLWEEIKNEDNNGDSDSNLPDVTAADNGDVLTVVNGAWDKATPSGGDIFTVNFNTQNGQYDRTWQEIYDAIAAGKIGKCLLDLSLADGPIVQQIIVAALPPSLSGSGYVVYGLTANINDTTAFVSVAVAETADSYPVVD